MTDAMRCHTVVGLNVRPLGIFVPLVYVEWAFQAASVYKLEESG